MRLCKRSLQRSVQCQLRIMFVANLVPSWKKVRSEEALLCGTSKDNTIFMVANTISVRVLQ